MGKVFGFTPDYLVRLPLVDETGKLVEELVEYNVRLNVPMEVRDGYGNVLTYEYVRMTHDGEMRLSYGSTDRCWFDLRDAFSDMSQYDVEGMYAMCVGGREYFADRTAEGIQVMMRGHAGMDPYEDTFGKMLDGLLDLFGGVSDFIEPVEMSKEIEREFRMELGQFPNVEEDEESDEANRLRLNLEKFMEDNLSATIYPSVPGMTGGSVEDLLGKLFDFSDEDEGTDDSV